MRPASWLCSSVHQLSSVLAAASAYTFEDLLSESCGRLRDVAVLRTDDASAHGLPACCHNLGRSAFVPDQWSSGHSAWPVSVLTPLQLRVLAWL